MRRVGTTSRENRTSDKTFILTEVKPDDPSPRDRTFDPNARGAFTKINHVQGPVNTRRSEANRELQPF